MPSLIDSVSPRYLLALVQCLEDEGGFSCTAALRMAGLTRAMLTQPRVPITSVLLAMQELASTSGRTDLGFVRGLRLRLGMGDVFGQMLLSASTLREALTNIAPFIPLLSPVMRLQVHDSGSDCIAEWSISKPMPYDSCVIALETAVVAAHRHIQFALQEKEASCSISFSWREPAHAARYRQFPGMRTHFGGSGEPRVMVRYAAHVVDCPLPMADEYALREAQRLASANLQEIQANYSFAEWVRYVLTHVQDQSLTQESVAQLLNMSGKTLGRHLAKENQRFGEIAQQVREERARHMLAHTFLPVGEIAMQLGYATLANFSRGFKASTGQSPSAFRDGARGGT